MVKFVCVFEDSRELDAMSSLVESVAAEMAVDAEVLRYQCIYQATNDLGLNCDGCESETEFYRCPKHFGKEVQLNVLLMDTDTAERFNEIWPTEEVKAKFPKPAILSYTTEQSSAVRRRHGMNATTLLAGHENDVEIVAAVRLHISFTMSLQ